MHRRLSLAAAVLATATAVRAGSLRDVKHIVLFMQENRAFDHVSQSQDGPDGSTLNILTAARF